MEDPCYILSKGNLGFWIETKQIPLERVRLSPLPACQFWGFGSTPNPNTQSHTSQNLGPIDSLQYSRHNIPLAQALPPSKTMPQVPLESCATAVSRTSVWYLGKRVGLVDWLAMVGHQGGKGFSTSFKHLRQLLDCHGKDIPWSHTWT